MKQALTQNDIRLIEWLGSTYPSQHFVLSHKKGLGVILKQAKTFREGGRML